MKNRILKTSLLALACFAAAEGRGAIQAGMNELRIDGALQLMSTDGMDMTSLSGQIVYNKFVRDNLSWGLSVRPQLQERSPDEGDDQTSMTLFVLGRGDYYLVSQNPDQVPYIGAHAGFINYEMSGEGYDESETTVTYGVQGGWKMFLSENTAFNIELDLSMYTMDGEEEEDVSVMSVFFGYSVYF